MVHWRVSLVDPESSLRVPAFPRLGEGASSQPPGQTEAIDGGNPGEAPPWGSIQEVEAVARATKQVFPVQQRAGEK